MRPAAGRQVQREGELVALLTQERQDIVTSLVSLGQERSFVTLDQVLEHAPPDLDVEDLRVEIDRSDLLVVQVVDIDDWHDRWLLMVLVVASSLTPDPVDAKDARANTCTVGCQPTDGAADGPE